ncbi:MAG TPA: outer membrane beta-barrel protein [Candidatus Deferrimicrobium sp.]|nr:outer membrane beta-barrel protein [Candidatus Deferrimicrobium sp.]
MIKKFIPIAIMIFVLGSGYAFGFEAGVTGGAMSKKIDSGFHYGLAVTSGFLIPMVKFEFELYKMKENVATVATKEKALCVGVKFRPKLGNFAPYVIVGVGGEFDKFGLDLGDYHKFTFIGGGCHFFIIDMLSVRGDIRFMHFSDMDKTRFSAGVFLHI